MLVMSILDSMDGVSSVETCLGDSSTDENDKVIHFTYDPINILLRTAVKSLKKVGLKARVKQSISLDNCMTCDLDNKGGNLGVTDETENDHTNIDDEQREHSSVKRSSLYVQGICCMSEVPPVTNILRRASNSESERFCVYKNTRS